MVIEAEPFLAYTDAQRLCDWIGGGAHAYLTENGVGPVVRVIPTLEGDMTASVGDFIIKGVQGEFYPCKPDIFLATYEPESHKSDSEADR